MSNLAPQLLAIAAGLTWGLLAPSAFAAPEEELHPICDNQELLSAMRTINQACTEVTCDFKSLKGGLHKIDKATLLAVMKSQKLYGVYVFFKTGRSSLNRNDVFDWKTKEDQLRSLRGVEYGDKGVVFVLGRASTIGGNKSINRELAKERARNVLKYLKKIGVPCKRFKAAWFGQEILYLNESDTAQINAHPKDYRSNLAILNQSAHVFVYPCRPLL